MLFFIWSFELVLYVRGSGFPDTWKVVSRARCGFWVLEECFEIRFALGAFV